MAPGGQADDGTQVDRQVGGVGHERPIRPKQGAREVEALLDVDADAGRCTSTLMSMLAVTQALHLGSTTMVLMSSIRMAGPGISWPGLNFFNSKHGHDEQGWGQGKGRAGQGKGQGMRQGQGQGVAGQGLGRV
ncbi:MAG: hypothetical protein FRX49_05916 [Trebouxia sp. A1-2]|nr:MAG: hypothetical protein FRX49_05916 [Trebouxia sp. A1-2]